MSPEELHYMLAEAIRTMPEYTNSQDVRPVTREQSTWQARALALVELQERLLDIASFRDAISRTKHSRVRGDAGNELFQILTTALARAELQLPQGARGVFVPLGSHIDALRALSDILRGATQDILIVDPYADDALPLRLLHFAPERISIRILRDARYRDCGTRLAAAQAAWTKQYAAARPLSIRNAPDRSLHDRFIAQDRSSVFLVSQSFKDLAERSPATIQRADSALASEKLNAYEDLWQQSPDIS